MIFTFTCHPGPAIQNAVFLACCLSILVHVFRAAGRVVVSEIVPLEGGRYEDRPAPKQLPSRQVIVLFPKGSLFFAGQASSKRTFPSGRSQGMAVILRLRGRNEIGSTFLRVIDRYAKSIQANHGKLI